MLVLCARSDLAGVERDVLEAAAKAGRDAPRVVGLRVDVTSRESVEGAAREVKEAVGYLDVLVNNAGFLEQGLPIVESDPDVWWVVLIS